MRRLIDAALRLLYPLRAECMGCGSRVGMETEWVCPACRQALAKNWIGAGKPPGPAILGAAYAYRYSGPAGRMVRRLKYGGVRGLAALMGADMARAFSAIQPTGVELVAPVPMHAKRLKARGFNHAEALAAQVASALNLPCENALERVRNTKQQAVLDDAQRRGNMKDAFAVCGDVSGKRVLLVDDVCTTGATALECARTLAEGGARGVYLLCFAIADKYS